MGVYKKTFNQLSESCPLNNRCQRVRWDRTTLYVQALCGDLLPFCYSSLLLRFQIQRISRREFMNGQRIPTRGCRSVRSAHNGYSDGVLWTVQVRIHCNNWSSLASMQPGPQLGISSLALAGVQATHWSTLFQMATGASFSSASSLLDLTWSLTDTLLHRTIWLSNSDNYWVSLELRPRWYTLISPEKCGI